MTKIKSFARVIILVMITSLLFTGSTTSIYGEQADVSELNITVNCNQSISYLNTETWVKIDGGFSTTAKAYANTKSPTSISLPPSATYKAKIIVPAGFDVMNVSLDSQPLTYSDSYPLNLSTSGSHELVINLERKSQFSLFSAVDFVDNIVNMSNWKPSPQAVDLNAYSIPIKRNDQDIVLVLDTSGSLAWGLNGEKSPENGKSRLDSLKQSMNDLLDTLIKDPGGNSRISIVTFNTTAEVMQDWTTVDQLKNGELTFVKNKIQSLTAKGGTMTDLGLKFTRNQFEKANGSSNDRYVLLFTDGIAGSFDLMPSFKDRVEVSYYDQYGATHVDSWPFYADSINTVTSLSPAYYTNNFRVMAEEINQATVLKGERGKVLTNVNAMVTGYGPTESKIPYYGLYLSPWGGESDSNAWDTYTNYTNYSNNLRSYYSDSNITNSQFYSGKAGGNFPRSAMGLGATIYGLGIFSADNYTGDVPGIVNDIMGRVVSDGLENFIMIDKKNDMTDAFKKLLGRVSGVYTGLSMRYYYDNKRYTVIDAAGGNIIEDENGKTCIEWNDIELAPGNSYDKKVQLQSLFMKNTNPGNILSIGYQGEGIFVPIEQTYIMTTVN